MNDPPFLIPVAVRRVLDAADAFAAQTGAGTDAALDLLVELAANDPAVERWLLLYGGNVLLDEVGE